MTLKFRFSIGVLFSLSLHAFLISVFVQWYPGILKHHDWRFGNFSLFSEDNFAKSNLPILTKKKSPKKIIVEKIFFPDIVLSEQIKKIKKKIEPQISLRTILTQVEKYPERLDENAFSNKKLSLQVGELLTHLKPINYYDNVQEKGKLRLNVKELRQYRNLLNEFLSKKWEVPIHLKGSDYSALVKFEIKKNGRVLGWKIEESSNIIINKMLNNLLKNLQFLPSLPESYTENTYKFGVKFTPATLN